MKFNIVTDEDYMEKRTKSIEDSVDLNDLIKNIYRDRIEWIECQQSINMVKYAIENNSYELFSDIKGMCDFIYPPDLDWDKDLRDFSHAKKIAIEKWIKNYNKK